MELAQAHSRRLCLARRSSLLLLPVSLVGNAQAKPRPSTNQEAGSESAFIKGLLERSEANRRRTTRTAWLIQQRNFKVNTVLYSVFATRVKQQLPCRTTLSMRRAAQQVEG